MEKSRNNVFFTFFLIQMCQKCTSRNDGLHKTQGLIVWFVIKSLMHISLMQPLSVGPYKGQIESGIFRIYFGKNHRSVK